MTDKPDHEREVREARESALDPCNHHFPAPCLDHVSKFTGLSGDVCYVLMNLQDELDGL